MENIKVLREEAYRLVYSGFWETIKDFMRYRIEQLEDDLFQLTFDEINDRQRLVIIVQKQELERFIRTIEALAAEYISSQNKDIRNSHLESNAL